MIFTANMPTKISAAENNTNAAYNQKIIAHASIVTAPLQVSNAFSADFFKNVMKKNK
jgi:hypothetical protein